VLNIVKEIIPAHLIGICCVYKLASPKSTEILPGQATRSTLRKTNMEKVFESSADLAKSITWGASKQTYYTIRYLVDRERVDDAYRTYAYFRWVDDRIDQPQSQLAERSAFVERQRALMNCLYHGQTPLDLTVEEQMLVDLVHSDREMNSGLQTYIRNMMSVMVFDAYRRGRLISQKELNEYTRWLATAVTEAMHYFIGHCCASPHNETRYLAVSAAHIVHMLRDAQDDIRDGYINIPREYLESHHIAAGDVNSDAYRMWVKSRVELARNYFKIGVRYLSQVQNPRCRLAGYSYTARFTQVLDAIEKSDYRLREDYSEFRHLTTALRMARTVLGLAFSSPQPELVTRTRSEA
jgi:phytoene/squalene synthetase